VFVLVGLFPDFSPESSPAKERVEQSKVDPEAHKQGWTQRKLTRITQSQRRREERTRPDDLISDQHGPSN
jgi:hypothetical protein